MHIMPNQVNLYIAIDVFDFNYVTQTGVVIHNDEFLSKSS